MTGRKTYKGFFKPKNPKKYKGDPTNIIYRSLWERKVMTFLDENDSVLEWQSEELAIPYKSPKDNRIHRYFPDFVAKLELPDGSIKTVVMEVKPKKETIEPKVKSKKTKQYINEVVTWGVNQAKWKSAREYCADKGYEFRLITEDDLRIRS
jgi:hypothetical protein